MCFILGLTALGLSLKSVGSSEDTFKRNWKSDSTPYNHICQIGLEPAVPTIYDDIQITTFGESSDSCVPRYSSYQVIGVEIRIDFTHTYTQMCAPVMMAWRHTLTLEAGALTTGTYQATAYINHAACASIEFHVFNEVIKHYLPVVIQQD
jgi:hypothetical protein